ncbi:histidine kinase [Coriobacterium glomerans PW2]|uniref:histidine kinase n=2 Tax=Coriobacterium TaxID=33870 RepID=F2N791_CORGP|nr:histidine kinase [Coriobacterium glomerans PW2]
MRCLASVLLYALVIAALLFAVDSVRNSMFDNAFPSMSTVLAHSSALARDDFEELSDTALARCHIVIFDADGGRLYASSRRIARQISPDELSVINDYDQRTFYEVFSGRADGDDGYTILSCTFDAGYMKRIKSSCTLDSDLNILGGSLFQGRRALKKQEFDFIKGIYNTSMSVERYDYRTASGEARTLVLIAPLVSDAAYARVVAEANRVWIFAAPLFLAATAGAGWCMAHQIRRATRPLDRAIGAWRTQRVSLVDREGIPTELVPVYDSFVELMRQVERAHDERQRLITDISHDLKTPLTVIRGYARAFLDDRVPADRRRAYFSAISDKAVDAAEMIDDLFAYAKMEHPEYRPQMKREILGELIRRIGEEADAQVEQSACSLDISLPDHEMAAFVDAQLIGHMLLNLIANACAHNPAGTQILVSLRQQGAYAELSVADDGAGIPPDIAERAFEPFVTENTARTPGGGCGLGLAIARRCAELNGATIAIAERPHAPWRTEILVRIPLAEGPASGLVGSR